MDSVALVTGANGLSYKRVLCEQKCFDFGISTENNGQYLNVGLIGHKEGFGARAIVYDFYEVLT